MKRLLLAFLISAIIPAALTRAAGDADYTDGIIIVNEDWYGHQNSTVNFLDPDAADGNYWQYRIIQTENPGVELGCTNQYGAIWNGRLYLIAKQAKDPGADITGGRITVVDAKTMKLLHQQELIDPSGAQCDGRGFVGVDNHKGYISTSNGIWVFDLDNFTVTGQVAGSANPNAGGDGDKPNTDPTGSLYHGQSGMMVSAAGRIFAAHQQYGLLVIDPSADKVTDVIALDFVQEKAAIGSVVKSKDGMLWLSVAKSSNGNGAALDCLVRVNPSTLETTVVNCPEGIYGPANSWYAWTPDAFVASQHTNSLYWKGGANSWFSGTKIFRYDIDNNSMTLFADLSADGDNWKLYGCSLGVDPANDDVYMSLYHEFSIPTYITRRYSSAGEKIRDYEMIQNYWFPSNMIFVNPSTVGIGSVKSERIRVFWQNGALNVCSDSAVTAAVYTSDGRLVARTDIAAGQTACPLNLQAGLYIIKVGMETHKIIVR